jgi:hypothetical protein
MGKAEIGENIAAAPDARDCGSGRAIPVLAVWFCGLRRHFSFVSPDAVVPLSAIIHRFRPSASNWKI